MSRPPVRTHLASSLSALLFVGSASPSLAQTKTPAAPTAAAAATPPGESAEYKQAIEAALEEYRLQHYEEARTLFARAHAIEPSARTERGLGMVEFELRHYVDALAHLQAALASQIKPLTEEQRRSADDLRQRAQQFVARYNLEIEPPSPGVRLELDGKLVDLDAAKLVTLEAGEHTLRIGGTNTETRELHIDVKGGEQQTLRIQLEIKGAAAAPSAPASVDAGTAAHRRSFLPLTLAASGAGVMIIGGVLGGIALHDAKGADTRSGSDADTAKTLALVSDVAVGVGVAAVVAGGIIWLVQRRQPGSDVQSEARVRFVGQNVSVRF